MFCGIVFKESIYSLKLLSFSQAFTKTMEKHVVTKSKKNLYCITQRNGSPNSNVKKLSDFFKKVLQWDILVC